MTDSSTSEKNTTGGKNLKASEDRVWAACDQLFRDGQAITEANVRAIVGGGTRVVIYKHIRSWEDKHRKDFLALEAAVASANAEAPPDVPKPLWDAFKPLWDQIHVLARRDARQHVAEARERLAADLAQLRADQAEVREAREVWQTEKANWSTRMADLNTQLSQASAQIQGLRSEIVELEGKVAAAQGELAASLQRLAEAQRVLQAAEERHQADQGRWAAQIDAARQEARLAVQGAEGREQAARAELASTSNALADTRVLLERTKLEAASAASRLVDAERERDTALQDLDAERRRRAPMATAKKRKPASGTRK